MRGIAVIVALWAGTLYGVSLPPMFIPNAGQAARGVRFIAEAGDQRVAYLQDRVIFRKSGATMELRFRGGSEQVDIEGMGEVSGRANFLRGNNPQAWQLGLPVYRAVRYRGLYDGIDAIYGVETGRFKSEFRVAPGADPGAIRLEFVGAVEVAIETDGALRVRNAEGVFRESAPVAYSEGSGGLRREVRVRYLVGEDRSVGFELGDYDRSVPLVIDPVITYSSYLGGSGNGAVTAVARDGLGNLYAGGWTESIDFPISGAYQATNRGGVDAFVVKLSPTGGSLLYATYLGGSGDDRVAGIAVDASGQAHIAGATGSSNFPLSAAARSSFVGGKEAFVAKLNVAGSGLLFSTFLGGSNVDAATAVAVDASGNVFVAGDTLSADFGTALPVQAALGGRTDAFVTRLNSAGAVTFSSFLGGALDEHAGGIATDGSGIVYVAGGTFSTNFPAASPLQATNAGGQDAFIAKIQTSAPVQLLYSSYLGGSGGSAAAPEQANGVAIDGSGNIYLAGVVSSTNFPVTSGALQTNAGGSRDVFLTKLNPSGTVRLYSTYLGWTGFDWASGLAVDASGNAYVVGYTSSVGFANVGGVQSGFAGLYDGFVAKLTAAGNSLAFSSLYGGAGSDQVNAVAVDGNGNIYIGGQTSSFDLPLQAALQTTNVSGNSGWVARLGETPPPSQLPGVSSVNVVYGSGGNATVTAQFSHAGGANQLTHVAVLLSRTASIDFACYVTYNPSTNTLALANNVAASGSSSVTPGSGSAQNTQCQVNGAGSSRTVAGNTLTLTLSLVLDSGFPGNNTVYLYAADANVNTGWVALAGTSQVSADSVSPASGSGASQVFTFVFSDTKSPSNVWGAAITINSTLSPVNACSLVWDRAAGTLALLYDSATGSSAKPFGSLATIQNSQCALGSASLTISGNSNILTIPLSFKGPFTGPKSVYMLAVGPNGNTGWLQKGTYSVFAGGVPVANSVTPSSGSGGSQAFTFVVSDQGGSNFITGAAMAILAPGGFNLNQSCYVIYDRGANTLSLAADSISNGTAGLTLGSAGSVSNSQCTLFGSGSSVAFGATTVSITLNLSFKPAFAGTKNLYLFAAEVGHNSGWQAVGVWSVPNIPPTVGVFAPNSGSGTLQSFTANASTVVSPSDLIALSIRFEAGDLGFCHLVYARGTGTIGLYNEAGTVVSTKPIGSSATLENPNCAVGYSAVTVTGANLALTVVVLFKSANFAGTHSIYVQAANSAGASAFVSKGSWTVP